MNILPKKRWHVRTKENIARVRKDEAEAAEKERQELLRIEAANREARLKILKEKSKQKLSQLVVSGTSRPNETAVEHINLFSDLEHAVQTTNKEHDKEIKDKKEEYEKKIGYLTYLGQDTNEALGKKNWYELPPGTSRFLRSDEVKDTYEKLVLRDADGKPKKIKLEEKDGEIAYKSKQRLDPINAFKKAENEKSHPKKQKLDKKDVTKKSYKNKNNQDINDKKAKLLKLREERLKREQEEKCKTEMFLMKLNGEMPEETKKKQPSRIIPKYNSQFNPELARQNYR